MPLTYLVDGYNVLHREPRFRGLLRHDLETARDALAEHVAAFCMASHDSVKLVFDGQGRQPETLTAPGADPRFEIIYSPGKHTADTVIERLVYTAPKRSNVVVVTSDNGLRGLCRGLGAFSMAPESFLTTVREARNRAASFQEQRQHKGSLSELEDRLDPSALRALRNLRKRLDE